MEKQDTPNQTTWWSDVPDERVIADACRGMANFTETGSVSMSEAAIDDIWVIAIRMGRSISAKPEREPLTANDAEYIRRLREIVKRMEKEAGHP